jgi:glucan phosphoethanolaminetransferase (alkaline phosphatase superfamily)
MPRELNELSKGGKIRGSPSIWQYAKRAGFRTVLLDPFRDRTTYLDLDEWPWIDAYFTFTGIPTYEREGALAEKLSSLLRERTPSFIYVNKFGVHFPYELSFPPEFSKFATANSSATLKRKLASLVRYAGLGSTNRDELIDSYNNGIVWGVDGFFKKLLPAVDLRNTLLLYTSDHGQNLFEGGGGITHCSIENIHPGEARVPLFALTELGSWEDRLRKAAESGFNRATHFEIFPTLLMALGYDGSWVSNRYGPSLMAVPVNRRREYLIPGGEGSWWYRAKWVPAD